MGWSQFLSDRSPEAIHRVGPYTLNFSWCENSYIAIIKLGCVNVGYLALVEDQVWVNGQVVVVKTPHSHILPFYRGRGIAKLIYRWAARYHTLLSAHVHSKSANRLWQRLMQEVPAITVKEARTPWHFETRPSYMNNPEYLTQHETVRVLMGRNVNRLKESRVH